MSTDRKAALDLKKAKLQAIRESKERKRRELEAKGSIVPELLNVSSDSSGGMRDHVREVDEMLSSLGITPVSDVLSSLSSSASLPPDESITNSNTAAATPPSSLTTSIVSTKSRTPKSLSIVKCGETNIPGKEIITYAKQTQTTASGHERDGSSSSSASSKGFMEDWWRPRKAHTFGYYDEYNLNPGLEWEDEFTVLAFDETEADDGEDGLGSLTHVDGTGTFHSKLPPGILPAGLPQVKAVEPAVTQGEPQPEQPKKIRELTAEEKQKIILSDSFLRFFDRTGPIMERALAEKTDYIVDYLGGMGDDEASEDRSTLRVVLNRRFEDEKWTKNRCVTALDWSPHFPELLLASYWSNNDPHEPDGVAIVWNTKFKKHTPEFIFHCQSVVTSAVFANFHPNLVIGGTYSGQIVLWDNRVHKRTPIQRTPLSAAAHTHPVYSVSVVGTQNAHNLIAISTDGRMCSWSLDMLSQPQETMELQWKQKKPAVTALSFPPSEVNNFLIGSEEGTCYQGCRHGNRAGIIESYEGHQGPVTGLAVHNSVGSIDFSHLFLTSSFDWTIKLWSVKDSRPLHTFEHNSDYVYDICWSPVHPAVFAAVDGTGRVDLWHLNTDTEVPVAGINVAGNALNRVRWAPNGQFLVAGDDVGRVWVYEVGEGLSQPRVDEWNKLLYTLQELKNNNADQELERANHQPSYTSSGPSSIASPYSFSY